MKIRARKISDMMNSKLMTQTTLAEAAGVSRATVNVSLAKGSCSVPTLAKIAKALGVDPAELIEKEA